MNTTTKKKPIATKKIEPIKQEPIEMPKKKTYEAGDEIMTTSVTAGELIMIGRKSGRYYSWSGYGDKMPVEYQDIRAELYTSNSPYLFKPLFLIEDEEYLAMPEAKKIRDAYATFLTVKDIDEIFALDGPSFEKTIKNLPKGIKDSFKAVAAQRIQSGALDSMNKIKVIDAILGTDLFNSYVAMV